MISYGRCPLLSSEEDPDSNHRFTHSGLVRTGQCTHRPAAKGVSPIRSFSMGRQLFLSGNTQWPNGGRRNCGVCYARAIWTRSAGVVALAAWTSMLCAKTSRTSVDPPAGARQLLQVRGERVRIYTCADPARVAVDAQRPGRQAYK